MSQKITLFVNSRFNKDLGDRVGVTGINWINVAFKIDKEGNITDVQSRGPHPILEQEALRVINALPKWNRENNEENRSQFHIIYQLFIRWRIRENILESKIRSSHCGFL